MFVDQKKALSLLRQGEVLAVPTETVFGMACDALQDAALLNLYNLKNRDLNKPIVIQLAKTQQIYPFLSHVPFDLEKLMQAYWPGPLTLVLPVKTNQVSKLARSDLTTAGFRITAHDQTRQLIEAYGPLAITSANLSNKTPLMSAKAIEKEFGEEFPILLANEQDALGVASTVLAYVDASWVIVRLGTVSAKDLAKILGYWPSVVQFTDLKKQTYTIRPQLHLREKPYNGEVKVVLGYQERSYPLADEVLCLGDLKDPKQVQANLPALLKKIQEEAYPHVWVDLNFPKEGALKEFASTLERAVRTSI